MLSKEISRRRFLKKSGIITIGFNFLAGCHLNGNNLNSESNSLPPGLKNDPGINAWLQVLEDGGIRVLTGKMELGQGIRIAVAQVAAEELNTDPELVNVNLAETGVTPNEGVTAGSRSIETSAMSIRHAAAAARNILLDRAAEKLQVSASKLILENGKVKTKNGNREILFAEVLDGKQIMENVTAPVTLKPKKEYQWVGKPVKRKDIGKMVIGEQVYVHDLRFPEMVHARIIRPLGYTSILVDYSEEDLAKNVEGILKVIRNGSFLAVITEEEYQAVRAQEFLIKNSRWTNPQRMPSGQSLKEYLRILPSESVNVNDRGMVNFNGSSLKASYFKPYIMHGALGPSCAVARYDGSLLQIWSHSQGVYPLRECISDLTGVPVNKIHIAGVPGSGCYGHNGADDVAADVSLLAMAYPGRHIRVQWSRAEEHGWEPYGSAMIMELEASLDPSGKIENWQYDLWSDTHSTRPRGTASNLLAARYTEDPVDGISGGYPGGGYRNGIPYYNIPNMRIN